MPTEQWVWVVGRYKAANGVFDTKEAAIAYKERLKVIYGTSEDIWIDMLPLNVSKKAEGEAAEPTIAPV